MGKELSLEQQEIFEFLAALLAQRRSGKLEIVAGAIKGAVFLKNGKLVDARLGHLTGFQAVNAIASLRHARFHFDPLVIPRLSSSITASERVVLKQFFGIEAADSTISSVPDSGADIDEATLARPVSIEPRDATALAPEVIDVPTVIDVTLPNHVTNRPTDVANLISPAPFSSQTRSWASYLAVLTISAIAIAIVAAAILLKREYRERMSTTAVATVETPVNPVRPADPVMSVEPAPAPAAEDTAVNYKPTRASADLSGMWNVVNTVQATTYKSFQNMQIGFVLSITQTGTSFRADGQKVSENGRVLPATGRTPIHVKGVIQGDDVKGNFVEEGESRTTNGRFIWKLNRASGTLTGTFATTAARAGGKSSARRKT